MALLQALLDKVDDQEKEIQRLQRDGKAGEELVAAVKGGREKMTPKEHAKAVELVVALVQARDKIREEREDNFDVLGVVAKGRLPSEQIFMDILKHGCSNLLKQGLNGFQILIRGRKWPPAPSVWFRDLQV